MTLWLARQWLVRGFITRTDLLADVAKDYKY